MSRAALLSLLLVVGCSSAPEAPPIVEAPARRLFGDRSVAPDAGLVAAFRARFAALKDAPACQASLVRDEPELAHALFLETVDDAARGQLAHAFMRAHSTAAYLESERARRAAPDAHTRGRAAFARALAARATTESEAATAGFLEAGDSFLAQEAAYLTALLGGECVVRGPGERPPVTIVQALVLAESPRAFDVALQTRHVTALLLLEVTSLEARRAVARITLERRQPLEALRHAVTLVREQGERVPASDRLLLARAHQVAAQTEQSLAEALLAADDAKRERDLRTEASSRALVAELMIDLSRPDAAADEFDAAERLFLQAGDPAGRLRQAVNRAGVLLRVKRVDDALGALSPVLGLSLPGEEGADLTCRRDVTAALLELVAGRAGGDETARRVEQAVDVARAAGAYRAVEQYSALPGRLRPGPG